MAKIIDSYGLPPPLFRAIVHANSLHSTGGAKRTITQLIAPPLQFYLGKVHGDSIEVEAAKRIWSLHGSIVHKIIEEYGQSGAELAEIVEQRVFAPVNDWLVSGKFDLVHWLVKAMLEDYKYTSCYAVSMGLKEEWEQQENGYLLLMKRGAEEELRKLACSIRNLRICAILRDWGPRMKHEFPVPVKLIDVPVWEESKALDFFSERVRLHREAEQGDAMPPECTEAERWIRPEAVAVVKEGRKTAVKLFRLKEHNNSQAEAEAEANHYVGEMKDSKGVTLEIRKSEARRCIDYCDCNVVCPYWQARLKAGAGEAASEEGWQE